MEMTTFGTLIYWVCSHKSTETTNIQFEDNRQTGRHRTFGLPEKQKRIQRLCVDIMIWMTFRTTAVKSVCACSENGSNTCSLLFPLILPDAISAWTIMVPTCQIILHKWCHPHLLILKQTQGKAPNQTPFSRGREGEGKLMDTVSRDHWKPALWLLKIRPDNPLTRTPVHSFRRKEKDESQRRYLPAEAYQ